MEPVVTLTHRNVCKDGFTVVDAVDAGERPFIAPRAPRSTTAAHAAACASRAPPAAVAAPLATAAPLRARAREVE